ncbi:MAG: vanadium-dependent haloperoxidase [Verrucomicrobia bacterium]|nr:vanadium-dependent haloperoxidase [Verrucomicrobiota bacterium]
MNTKTSIVELGTAAGREENERARRAAFTMHRPANKPAASERSLAKPQRSWLKLTLLSAAFLLTAALPRADVISDWNKTSFDTMAANFPDHIQITRGMAMMHVAQFEAVNAVVGGYTPYLLTLSAPNASAEAAATQAAFVVMTNQVPGAVSPLRGALNRSLQTIPDGPAKASGITLGQHVGEVVVLLRASDASRITVPYTPTLAPGKWRPMPPNFTPAILPHWRYVTPWTMSRSSQFRSPPPPALNSDIYTRDFKETRDYGSATGSKRTPEQAELTKGFHNQPVELVDWMARAAMALRPLTLIESARMFALVSMVQADSFVGSLEACYSYNYWSVITAIREADTDGNDDTEKVATWSPLANINYVPEYPNLWVANLGAGAEVLTSIFGDDLTITILSSGSPRPRTYARFSDVVTELGNTAVYSGFSFRNACEAGEQRGRAMARHAVENLLTPTPKLAGQLQAGEFRLTTKTRGSLAQRIEYSGDLLNWIPLTNYLSTDFTLQILDRDAASADHRFYRAALE